MFRIEVDFSKHLLCEQMHQPVTMVVQNRRHVHIITTKTTADKLTTCVSQHQVLFDKRHTNYKDNNLHIWQRITDQLGSANGE